MLQKEIIQIRRLLIESLIIFSLAAICLIVYKNFKPFAFPGIELKFFWVFVSYLILLIILYQMEILNFIFKVIDYLPLIKKLKMSLNFMMYINTKSKITKVELIKGSINSTFQILLTIFLLLLLFQEFYSIPKWININYFLIIVIIFGVITVITNNETETEKVQPAIITKKDYVLIAISGIVGAIIVWYKIRDIGLVSYLIGCMSGLLIITLSILMIEESNE